MAVALAVRKAPAHHTHDQGGGSIPEPYIMYFYPLALASAGKAREIIGPKA